MQDLKICLVSLTISPDSQDGSAKFIKGVYDYLKERGYNVKVLTGKWNVALNDPDIMQYNLIRKSYWWMPLFFIKVFSYLRQNKFDIIHVNGPKGALPLLFLNKKPFIATIHDLGPLETTFSIIPVEKYLIMRVLKKATVLTTCSKFVKKEIVQFFPKLSNKCIVNIYSAIDKKFKPELGKASQLKRKLGIEGPILVYLGRIAQYKDIENVIKAYYLAKAEIGNLALVIGGKPDFTMQKMYEKWKKEYSDIHFIGFIPDEQVPTYYSLGDIFITYSFASEGFGLTPVEAIACGTPVICSSLLVYKEVLEDNAVFVEPKRPDLLAEQIVLLLNDRDRRESLIKKAQEYITKFNWKTVGKKLEKVYEALI
jgi:glycosyltransferase involved in cell wall biosynthesis